MTTFPENFSFERLSECKGNAGSYERSSVIVRQTRPLVARGLVYQLEHCEVESIEATALSDAWPIIMRQINTAHTKFSPDNEDYFDQFEEADDHIVSTFSASEFTFNLKQRPRHKFSTGYLLDGETWFTTHTLKRDSSPEQKLIGNSLEEVVALMAMNAQFTCQLDIADMELIYKIMRMTGFKP